MTRLLVPRERTMLRMLAQLAEDHTGTGARDGDPKSNAPWSRISLEAGITAWRRLPPVMHGLPTGAYLARRTPLSSVHFLGVAVYSAPHLYAALQVFFRYFPALVDVEQFHCRTMDRQLAGVWPTHNESVPASLRDFAFTQVVDLAAHAGNRTVRPVRVDLPQSSSPPGTDYARLFGCPVHFRREPAGIVFETDTLAVPLYTTNPALHALALQRLAAFDRWATRIGDQVATILLDLLEQGEPRLLAVAERLDMNPRTLQTRLAEEGLTFGDLLWELREQKAMRLLCETKLPVARIASELGYRSPGSFARAFREWRGMSPARFRRQFVGAASGERRHDRADDPRLRNRQSLLLPSPPARM